MAEQMRDRLVAVAQRMFSARGYHAVSIDDIVAEARVARMSLYKNFASKEDLIVATLQREDQDFRHWLSHSLPSALQAQPEERLTHLFRAMHDRFVSTGYYGCAFVRAIIEFPDRQHPVHHWAKQNKEVIRSYLRTLAAEAHVLNPLMLAEQLYLLFEGAIIASQLHAEPWPADYAAQAASSLLLAARQPTTAA